MPGLVLGVLLAVAVAAVTVYTRPYWGPLVEGPGGEAGAPAGLESRVAELRAAIPADSSSALSYMSARIATLETVLSQGGNQDHGTSPNSGVEGKQVSIRVCLVGCRLNKKKKHKH